MEERAGCFYLLSLSSVFLEIVVWLTVPCVCLQFVIVVFPDHTHFLYFETKKSIHYNKW